MKKMNFKFSALVSRLCVALLALLGFGCNDKNGDDVLLMYGCPTGHWEIKGEVTDEADKPVAGASVKVTYPNYDSSFYAVEVKTDEAGAYTSVGAGTDAEFKVVCIPDDPALEPDSTVVKLKYSDPDPKNMWDLGSAGATVNFKLKKK